MSNKNIEEDIKELNRLYDIAEVVLPEYSTAKIVYRISENQRIAIRNILADRERLLKENKKLKKQDEKDFTLVYMKGYEACRQKYDNLVNAIKGKIEELDKLIKECNEDERYVGEIPIYAHDKQVLQDLLETIEGEKK